MILAKALNAWRIGPPSPENDHQTDLYRRDLVLITAEDNPLAHNVFMCASFFYCKNNQIAMAPFHEWTFHGAIDLKEVFVPFGHRCPEGNEYEDTNSMMGPEHSELLAEQVGSLSCFLSLWRQRIQEEISLISFFQKCNLKKLYRWDSILRKHNSARC